jgi:hypothetical protein
VYFDYLNMAASQYTAANCEPTLSPTEAAESLNSDLFVRRFFERAEREGIRFSAALDQEAKQLAPIRRLLPRREHWLDLAKVVLVIALFGVVFSAGYFYRTWPLDRGGLDPHSQRPNDTVFAAHTAIYDRQIADLVAMNAELQAHAESLRAVLAETAEQLRVTENDRNAKLEGREKLEASRGAWEAQLKSAEEELAQSQALIASARHEAAKQRDRVYDVEASLVEDKVRIKNLADDLAEKSAALDQETQLLSLGHDVTDLMGARNLHIVDVVDTDPKGKNRPVFGRIFFTEGKSLVFYAYDLNEAKIQKANYEYRVWATQENGDKQVRRLGIFYSDDKAQRRWVFKCDDPKTLREIDSVFVTLESAAGDPTRPKGPNLMYAYLRGQPNHP